jgi:putative ABC transport system substrate-binding protein
MTVTIGRRELLVALGGAAAAWPLAARAQQPGKLPTVGYTGATTASAQREWTDAFVQRLRELGWIEGRTIAVEYRWAEGRTERAAEIAAEFVQRKVDVIVTSGTGMVLAGKQAASVIPIVFAATGDPVGTGLVTSLARPGGNVTGQSNQVPDLVGKRLELLREVVPSLGRMALLANVGNPVVILEIDQIQASARTLALEVIPLEILRGADIVPAFEALKDRAEALYIAIDPLTSTHRVRINTLALAERLPTMHATKAG